jgi:fucose permease
MVTVLLVIIYIAFISLGLPDSILGAAWPAMYPALRVPVSGAGVVSMIIAAGTIVSSLLSGRTVRRLGTGMVTLVSVGMTAVALLGFSFSGAFWMLCLWAVPLGLGAGSVDAALNNFVALHYPSRHMNWLHCFWGVGATAGPLVMGYCLSGGLLWGAGYRVIGLAQAALVVALAFSLPLWKKARAETQSAEEGPKQTIGIRQALKLPGAKLMMPAFFCYCGVEATTGLWIASYLVLVRGAAEDRAARFASIFYLGITAGRFVSGLVSDRLGNRAMVRIGQAVILCGVALILIFTQTGLVLAGIVLLGLGCAPVFPALLHETPANFGKKNSQALMGMQMASAYIGTTLMPPLFGLIANTLTIGLLPAFVLLLAAGMLVLTESANRRLRRSGG